MKVIKILICIEQEEGFDPEVLVSKALDNMAEANYDWAIIETGKEYDGLNLAIESEERI